MLIPHVGALAAKASYTASDVKAATPAAPVLRAPNAAQSAGPTLCHCPADAVNTATVAAPTSAMATTSLGAIAIVALDVRDTTRALPGAGRPLYVKCAVPTDHDVPIYKGARIPKLGASDDGRYVGIVWHMQPKQVVAHRAIALIAVVTKGVVKMRGVTEVVEGSPMMLANGDAIGICLQGGRVQLW